MSLGLQKEDLHRLRRADTQKAESQLQEVAHRLEECESGTGELRVIPEDPVMIIKIMKLAGQLHQIIRQRMRRVLMLTDEKCLREKRQALHQIAFFLLDKKGQRQGSR